MLKYTTIYDAITFLRGKLFSVFFNFENKFFSGIIHGIHDFETAFKSPKLSIFIMYNPCSIINILLTI